MARMPFTDAMQKGMGRCRSHSWFCCSGAAAAAGEAGHLLARAAACEMAHNLRGAQLQVAAKGHGAGGGGPDGAWLRKALLHDAGQGEAHLLQLVCDVLLFVCEVLPSGPGALILTRCHVGSLWVLTDLLFDQRIKVLRVPSPGSSHMMVLTCRASRTCSRRRRFPAKKNLPCMTYRQHT